MGYHTFGGFWGFVPWLHKYILFATESEYYEYINR